MAARAIPLLLAALAVSACADPFEGEPAGWEYRAVIRWTSSGVPHILADDLPSASFGQGYAFARLNACILADMVVKVRSERASFFGPGEAGENLDSDFAHLHLDIYGRAERGFEAQPADMQDAIRGYVDGYNEYVTTRAEELPCGAQPWLRAITPIDLFAHYTELATLASARQMHEYIATAQPPSAGRELTPSRTPLESLRARRPGSNGWAIGSERTASGRGMLVGNPHFPWEGELKLYESHLRVPGQLDVYGASLMGVLGVLIGFNEDVAWTHTVSDGQRFTMYSLTLDPADPTVYLYDGQPRAMQSQTYTIEVLGDDGETYEESRTLWSSHYGPILNVAPQFPWGRDLALTMRDANLDNSQLVRQFMEMNRAGSMDEFQGAHADVQGIPWVNTMAASADGRAWYTDATPTPNLSPAAIDAWLQRADGGDFLTGIFASLGLVLLDGSDSLYEWQDEPGARDPGLVPFSRVPKLERTDFVFNANDSHWLANPAEPLEGFSPLHGFERTPRSARTRMNAVILSETGPGTSSGEDGRFDFNELRIAALSNRGMPAELLRDAVVGRCQGVGPVEVDGASVDVTEACDALAGWDRRLDLDSVGAIVWRELVGDFDGASLVDAGVLYRKRFDPDDPIATPRDLAHPPETGPDRILVALAHAVQRLEAAGLGPRTRLGDAQFTKKRVDREGAMFETIPMHGGGAVEGVPNQIHYSVLKTTVGPAMPRGEVINATTDLTTEGYVVNYGTSYIMALEFTDDGPQASAFVTYGQSDDPLSPWHTDQTRAFSAKQWRPILFTEDAISADGDLEVEVIFGYEKSE